MNRLSCLVNFRSAGIYVAIAVVALLNAAVADSSEPLTQPPSEPAEAAGPAIAFTSDADAAFAKARQQSRRVLLFFTSDSCGWCRELEKKVHSQPEMISYTENFVCVKINVVERPELAEKFGASSLPRTMVFTADEEPVSLRIGYSPLAEHLAWLKKTRDEAPTSTEELIENAAFPQGQESFAAPPAVGAALEDARIVLWFISSETAPFNDPAWAAHAALLELLRENDLAPRVEHFYGRQLAERWKAAAAEGMLPNFIAGRVPDGLFAQLMAEGAVRDVISTRLRFPDATSSCSDFARFERVWQVPAAANPELAERTLECLLAPRAKASLGPLAELTNTERVLLTTKAKTVARAWLEYDFSELDKHWDEHAPQRCIAQEIDLEWVKGEREYRKDIEFRKLQFYGNSDLILAMIDTLSKTDSAVQPNWFVSTSQIVRSPTFVMLKRDGKEHRALAVGQWRWDIHPGNAADALFADAKKTQSTQRETLGSPAILAPPNGAVCGNEPIEIRWKKPETALTGDRFYSLMCNRDGRVFFNHLQAEDPFMLEVRGNSTLEIWQLSGSGRMLFSERVQLIYQPEAEAAAK